MNGLSPREAAVVLARVLARRALAEWDESQHSRVPAGSSQGGEFSPFAGAAYGEHTPATARKLIGYLEQETGMKFAVHGSVGRGQTSKNDIDIAVIDPTAGMSEAEREAHYQREMDEANQRESDIWGRAQRGEITKDEAMQQIYGETSPVDPIVSALAKIGFKPTEELGWLGIYVMRFKNAKTGHTVEVWTSHDTDHGDAESGPPLPFRRALGGKGSGDFGHAGRPGEIGGSAPNETSLGMAANLYARHYGNAKVVMFASQSILKGEPAPLDIVTPEAAYAAQTLVTAVRNAPEQDIPLFRGIGSEEPIESLEKLKVGDTVTFGQLTSFSERDDYAAYYAERAAGGSVGVTYELTTTGPVKSVATDRYTGFEHKEHVTEGKFEVVAIHEPKTGVRVPVGADVTGGRQFFVHHNRSITLKQVGVF